MTIKKEAVIIGGGPAGLAAAIEAAKYGAKVLLIDENKRPGGQLFKQIHKFFGSRAHNAGVRGVDIGKQLLKQTEETGVEIWLDSSAVGIFSDKRVAILHEGSTVVVQAERILISTGAAENALRFKGWTLPGVMGAGAAQTMVNVNRVLPGKRILMVGSGNVGVIVAYQLMQAGANVVGIVEGMDHIGAYGVHAAKIRRAGVPFYLNHTIKEARGREQVEQAVIARMQSGRIVAGTEEIIDVDAVCVAVGLRPLTELAYMAGVNHDFIPELGGFMPLHDENMESSLPGIYVAGDTAGVEEANTAMDEGRLAGIAMAQSLGYLAEEDGEAAKEIVRERLTALRQGPFGERRLQAKERILAKGEKRTVLPQETGGSSDMSILTDGYPSIEEINKATGWPDEERFARGPVAVIECVQKIPCNPCEAACPAHAITVGSPITNTPILDREKCIGCGLCVSACSGLAIFIVDKTYSETQGTVSFPFEYLPLPEKGDEVNALNRAGEFVCRGTVIRVMNPPGNDRTPVVTIAIPKEYTDTVRTMGRLKLEDTDRAFRKAEGGEIIDDEMLVCRCEEITAGEIRKAVREYEGTSVTEIKRRVRTGMGLCQGRTCGKLVTRIIQEELGKRADEVEPATNRPPVRPITFGELAGEEGGRTDEQGV